MRYMIIIKATKDSEPASCRPAPARTDGGLSRRAREAGVLVDGSGLQATSKGWRVRYRGANRTVVDGPFAETKELIAGYTIINVKSRAEPSSGLRDSRTRRSTAPIARSRCGRCSSSRISAPRRVERFRELGMSGAEKLS